MIHCNLNVLLAQRNLKISDVHKDTGISRTTLTSLAYGHAKGIQFDTLSTLCDYLHVDASELLSDQPVISNRQNFALPVNGNYFPCMFFLPGNFKYDISEQEKTGKFRK